MSPQDLITIQKLALLGILGGAAIGAISALVSTWLSKRSDERKHRSDLIIKGAIENYKINFETTKLVGGLVSPLDVYIIHMHKVIQIANKRKLTTKDIDKVFLESHRLQEYLMKKYQSESREKPSI